MEQVLVKIRDREYPLCMTVHAFAAIVDAGGGLEKLGNFLSGNGDAAKAIENTAYALGTLIREGEENRRITAECFGDGDAKPRKVPGPKDICSLLTPAEIMPLRDIVLRAIFRSMDQQMEAEPPKNGVSTEPQ